MPACVLLACRLLRQQARTHSIKRVLARLTAQPFFLLACLRHEAPPCFLTTTYKVPLRFPTMTPWQRSGPGHPVGRRREERRTSGRGAGGGTGGGRGGAAAAHGCGAAACRCGGLCCWATALLVRMTAVVFAVLSRLLPSGEGGPHQPTATCAPPACLDQLITHPPSRHPYLQSWRAGWPPQSRRSRRPPPPRALRALRLTSCGTAPGSRRAAGLSWGCMRRA